MPIFEAESIHKGSIMSTFYRTIGRFAESPDTQNLTP